MIIFPQVSIRLGYGFISLSRCQTLKYSLHLPFSFIQWIMKRIVYGLGWSSSTTVFRRFSSLTRSLLFCIFVTIGWFWLNFGAGDFWRMYSLGTYIRWKVFIKLIRKLISGSNVFCNLIIAMIIALSLSTKSHMVKQWIVGLLNPNWCYISKSR